MGIPFNNILILAAHTDDGELGMGATISRLVREGANVFYAAFSTADKSLPKEFPMGTLKDEVSKATRLLGIPESNLYLFPFEVRTFSYFRQELLEELINLRNSIKPDLIFCPTPRDLHQDHVVISNEAIRAFKMINIMAYEMPWNNLNFETNSFFQITKSDLDMKISALECYKSQRNKPYMKPDFIKGLAKVRGVQIGVEYAECFEIVRWISFV